jgi:hypothetical protein
MVTLYEFVLLSLQICWDVQPKHLLVKLEAFT